MNAVTFLLVESPSGLWRVMRGGATILQGLKLGSAIKQARQAAREEHALGRPARVEMSCLEATIELANYA